MNGRTVENSILAVGAACLAGLFSSVIGWIVYDIASIGASVLAGVFAGCAVAAMSLTYAAFELWRHW